MTSMTMDERSGVERLRAKERRRWMIVGGCLLLIAADLLFMWATGDLPRNITHLPPDLANGLATGMLVGAAICLFRILRTECDEHEIRARMFGAQVAVTAFLIAYPVWALFAIGHVLPPVNELILYAGVFILYLAAFFWRKYR